MSRADVRPDDEATLTGFEWVGDQKPDPDPSPEPERVSVRTWEPENEQQCQNCGASVSEQYRRVMGDNDDVVHACPACEDKKFGDERLTAGLRTISSRRRP